MTLGRDLDKVPAEGHVVLVARLREAAAITAGTTSVPGRHSAPPSRDPWILAHSPGGASRRRLTLPLPASTSLRASEGCSRWPTTSRRSEYDAGCFERVLPLFDQVDCPLTPAAIEESHLGVLAALEPAGGPGDDPCPTSRSWGRRRAGVSHEDLQQKLEVFAASRLGEQRLEVVRVARPMS